MPAPRRPAGLLHLARHDDTSGLFGQLARLHDRATYTMSMATLEPMEARLRAEVTAQGVSATDLGARSKVWAHYLRAVPRLALALRRQRVEVLHTHFYYPSLVGGMAGVLARTPARVLTRHHGDYHARMGGPGNRHVRLDQLATRLHHRVLAVSRFTAEHMTRVEGAPPGKVVVVHNGVDFQRVRPSSPQRVSALRQELGPDQRALILVAARLAEEKGVRVLLEALPQLQRTARRPFLVVSAGEGPQRKEFQELLAAQGTEHLVRFLGFRTDLPDLMSACDLLVLPSLSEAFGLVAAEALYLGLPVVASRVGGLPEVVSDGVDGLLLAPGDSDELAVTLSRLLNQPEELRRLAGAGRERIEAQFSILTMVRGYEEVYAELLQSATSRRGAGRQGAARP